tara:strand:+ start:100 stop:444 length:345 start_codon:yes stop_codon:yes gene_type:complete
MSNIIQFPKEKFGPPTNDAQLRDQFNKNKKRYVDNLVAHYSSQLANKFAMHGFKLEDEMFLKDFAYTVETIRSGLYRSLGMEHPFQEIMNETHKKIDIAHEYEYIDEGDESEDF